MPTIILNKRTTNPNIPMVPLPGFFDDFNRPDSTELGRTSREGRAWELLSESNTLQIVNGTASLEPGSRTTYGLYAVDALETDGTLRAVYSQISGATNFRLAFRIADARNFYTVNISSSSVELRRYLDLVSTPLKTEPLPATGTKRVEVVMAGAQISVVVDGQAVIRVTDSSFTGTRHGFQALPLSAGGTAIRVTEAEFIPA